MIPLLAAWDVVGVRRLGLSTTSVALFFPGSVIVWAYWLALRFFVMELLLRPPLAQISATLADGGGVDRPRLRLVVRLLIAIGAITVIAGTAVAGLFGTREVATVALGAGASLAVAVVIAGWLVGLLAQSVAGPIAELRAAAERVGSGEFDVHVPVVSVDEAGTLARAFNGMVAGLRDRERIRGLFGSYVDPDVAEHILRETSNVTGREVEVTILFLDIRGFTTFAERSEPSDVVEALNLLFERVVPIVHRNGGHVDKFIGDGLMAVFGAPREDPMHADHGLACALEIARATASLPNGLRVGIGVNSGRVTVGNLGGGGRFEFGVIGDTVNVAARVESATRQTGDSVLVSEHTRQRLTPGHPHLAERPAMPLKGKTEPVGLYALA